MNPRVACGQMIWPWISLAGVFSHGPWCVTSRVTSNELSKPASRVARTSSLKQPARRGEGGGHRPGFPPASLNAAGCVLVVGITTNACPTNSNRGIIISDMGLCSGERDRTQLNSASTVRMSLPPICQWYNLRT